MGIRGFSIVLICALALGVVVRFLDVPAWEAFARDESVTATGTTDPPTSASDLQVRSEVGFAWNEIEVFQGDGWSTVALHDGRCTPAGPGPWRLRAPGHLEVRSDGAAVDLVPDALIEIRGPEADLEALAEAFASRSLAERLRTAGLIAFERLPGRILWAVRVDGRWRELERGGALEVTADLEGGRRVTIGWEPTSGSRCEVDLEQILTERQTAPLPLRLVNGDGEPAAGVGVTFASAAKAVRYRPLDSATGRNCARIDVELTPCPAGASDADGRVLFDGVALGQSLGVLAIDPATGAWQRSTVEHDGTEHTIALGNEGVTVTGRLALPEDLPVSEADFQLVWRQSIEGVGTGLWVSANAAELRNHPVGSDGSFELVTTGPRSGSSARWELTVEVLAPRCGVAAVESVTEIGSTVDVGEIALVRAEPWVRIPEPLDGPTGLGWVVPLDQDAAAEWWARAALVDGALELHLVPAEGADGFVGRKDGREQALPGPETAPSAFVLRFGEGARWFHTDADGIVRESEIRRVMVRALVAENAPEGAWSLAVESQSSRLNLVDLGPEWLGETLWLSVTVPVGAHLRWSSDESSVVPMDSETIELTLR